MRSACGERQSRDASGAPADASGVLLRHRRRTDSLPLVTEQGRSRLKPWMLVSAIWLWPAIFNVVERVGQVRLQGWDPASTGELLFTFGDWLAYAIVTPALMRAPGARRTPLPTKAAGCTTETNVRDHG